MAEDMKKLQALHLGAYVAGLPESYAVVGGVTACGDDLKGKTNPEQGAIIDLDKSCASSFVQVDCGMVQLLDAAGLKALNTKVITDTYALPLSKIPGGLGFVTKVEDACEIIKPIVCTTQDIESGKCL